MPYKELHRVREWDREYRRRNYNPNDEGEYECFLCFRRFRSGAGFASHERWHQRERDNRE